MGVNVLDSELSKTFLDSLKYGVSGTFKIVFFYVVATMFYVYAEGWDISACIYFLTATITTVGYGDLHPTHEISRLVTCAVIVLGIVVVFGTINGFASDMIGATQGMLLEKQLKSHPIDEDNVNQAQYEKEILKRTHKTKFIFSIVILSTPIVLGTFFFRYNEGWTFVEAFYYCVVTSTTVGYGDLTIVYPSSRIASCLYMIVSVIVVAAAITTFATMQMEIEDGEKRIQALSKKVDFDLLRKLGKNGIRRYEFLVEMLLQNEVLDLDRDVDPWLRRFEELDHDKSGKINAADIAVLEQQNLNQITETQTLLASNQMTAANKETPEANERTLLFPEKDKDLA